MTISLTPAPEQPYTVGDNVTVTATVENGTENTVVTYKIGEGDWQNYPEGGIVLPNTAAGDVVVTVKATDGDKQATDTKTYVFDPAEALTITLDPATGTYYVGDEQNVTVTVKGAIATNPTITYKFGEEGEVQTYNAETGIVLPTAQAGTINLTVMVDDGGYEHTGATTATGTYTVNHKALTITLDPATAEFNVGAEAKVKVTVENVVGESVVEYKIGETEVEPVDGYIVLPNDKAGTVTLTVNAMDEREEEVTATGTYTFTAAPAITFDLVATPAQETYTVGTKVNVKVENIKNVVGDLYDITYTTNFTRDAQTYDSEKGIDITSDEAGTVTLTVTIDDLYEHAAEGTKTADYTFVKADAITITFDPASGTEFTVGQEAKVKVNITGAADGYEAEYMIGETEATPNEEGYIVLPNTATGDVTLSVSVYDGIEHEGADEDGLTTATATYTFKPMPVVATPTFSPESGTYTESVLMKISCETDGATIQYTLNPGENDWHDGNIVTWGLVDGKTRVLTVYARAKKDGMTMSEVASVTYTIIPAEPVATPTFSLVAGSYTGAQTVTIGCATDGATISYSTDGGNTWTEGNTVTVDKDMTIMAKAEKDGMTVSAVATAAYVIDIPEELPTITPFKGYYQIKNNGNGMYANIAGRKTLNFTDAPADKAGTVIWLETNDKGQVQSIRSQAADLQGYANRAMRYVPEMVNIVVNKINEMDGIENATGAGSVLGENGLGEIMEAFNEGFDHHLYVEQAQGGWRLYGKTPSMQHVVDFYREHKSQVEAKLPKLEQFINDALDKLISKIGGSSVFTDFSLHQIWEKMGGTLTEPVDEASIMAFYREVLNNKNYVWDFAYQTAQIYWGNVKNHPRYDELKAQLGDYADYIDEFVTQVRPDFKYYVIQRGDEPDYISEGNGEIINNDPRTLWTLEPRTDFTVNIAGEQFGCPYAGGVGGYATTNYTDFAYTVPEGVTAYKVASVENGVANLQALSGVIPAQTPVLLMAKEAKDYVLTLSTEAGTAVEGNLLVGPDYLIKTYELKTPMVESLFSLAKGVLGEQLYNQYVAQYEYLQLLYAGTVNNKYFWGLTRDDVMKCLNANGDDCVVRDLSGSKFIDNRQVKTNKAFLVSETDQTITISTLRGDVNHDGYVNIDDVTALIDYLLEVEGRACPYCANVNCDSTVNIVDVTYLIDILLGNISPYAEGGNGN